MKPKQFRSVPGAWAVPLGCLLTAIVSLGMIFVCQYTNQLSVFVLSGYLLFVLCGFFGAVFFSQQALCSIVLYEDRLLCKIPFSRNVEIIYEECYIGFDYHIQHGQRFWWVYFCYGKMPPYKNPQLGNRINSIKCQPGFVRVMYSDELYDALIKVLPKKQKVALVCARRHSGFEK